MINRIITFFALSIFLVVSPLSTSAQEELQIIQAEQGTEPSTILPVAAPTKPDDVPSAPDVRRFDSESFPSLVFTYWEQVAIEDAKRSRGLNRAPTEAELMRDLQMDGDAEKVKPPPEKRNITLSGIAYKANKNWTIWLNGQRVTPDAIPPEAIDLKVFRNYIEIKWFDEYTNRIIPIRLRPHQRFNIDTRIFLPG